MFGLYITNTFILIDLHIMLVLSSNYLVFLQVICFIFNFNILFYSLVIMIDINEFFRNSDWMYSFYLIFPFVDPLKFNFNILVYFLKIIISINDILYDFILIFCYVVFIFFITHTKFKSTKETFFYGDLSISLLTLFPFQESLCEYDEMD